MNKPEIQKAIEDARWIRETKRADLMRQYDKEIYGPELRKIMSLCGDTGHEESIPRSNGIGWITFDCKWCGKPMRYINPVGEECSVEDV